MESLPEKSDKGRYQFKFRGTECLNCGNELNIGDRYCSNCSQANSTKKLSIKDFLDEFFASLISYDSKLLNTLGALLLRPGKITRDYINGKRVSYTNPFRFLLSLAIIYFLMINFSGDFSELDKYGSNKEIDFFSGLNNLDFGKDLEAETEIRSTLDSVRQDIDIEALQKKIEIQDSLILAEPAKYYKNRVLTTNQNQRSKKLEFFTTLLKADSVYNFNEASEKYGVADNFENEMAFNLADGFLKFKSRPGGFVSSLISKLPFAVFFFLPVFALFIWLAYIRKKHGYTDHLIFSFHNTALLFILLIISYLVDSVFDITSNWILLIAFSVYLFQAMLKFYRQGVFKTLVKYLFLNAIFFILALFATLILVTGNFFTY